jgi:hypothetical protein
VSRPTWFWQVSESEAGYLAAKGLELCFPPGEPLEIRVIPDPEEDGA